MKKFFALSMMLACIMTFSVSATGLGGKLAIEDATIAPGQSVVFSIQLNNDIDISGFQLQMLLPMDIVFRK